MLQPIPYLDVIGYSLRSKFRPEDISILESLYPGYLQHRLARGAARINAQLVKRYAMPLGQSAPIFFAVGTLPPVITLTGRPALGSLEIAIRITTAGALGVAAFQWSQDGGRSWTAAAATAALVSLGQTGLTASFAVGTYSTDNAYNASPPVPEIVLGWLAAIVDVDAWQRRGANPQDPAIVEAVAERDAALVEIKEASDSKDGLYELPTNDLGGDSAVAVGGPVAYAEASPYVWTDVQRDAAVFEDRQRRGTGT